MQIKYGGSLKNTTQADPYAHLSQIEVKTDRFKSFPFDLAVTQSNTENVAMATMMTNFNGAHRELSNGASTKFLSQIEVKIKWLEVLPWKIPIMVAIATIMINFDRAYRELSNGASTKFLS